MEEPERGNPAPGCGDGAETLADAGRTERLTAAPEVGSDRKLLERVIARAPVAIAVMQAPDLEYTMVNPAYQALVGPQAQLIGRRYGDLFSGPAARRVEAVLRHVLGSGRACRLEQFEARMAGRAGATWWEGECLPLENDSGATTAVLVIAWDVTDRQGVEDALRDREERYALVVAGAEAIWDWDVVNKRVFFSPRWKELRGLSEEDVSDSEDEWTTRIHPADAPRVMAALQAHFEGRTAIFSEEYRTQHDDGHWIWIHDRGVAQRDPAGTVVRMAGSETDITDRKRAEQAVSASEARYRGIFAGAGVAIWEEDFSEVKAALDALEAAGVDDFPKYFAENPDFVARAMGMVRVVDVNPAAVHLYGARDRDALMNSLEDVIPPEAGAVFVKELIALAEGRTHFECDSPLRTLDGRPLEVLLSITFPPPDGDFRSVLVTLTDITERQRAEQVLREEDRRKDEFLATLSHELRNPLAPLRNSLDLLRNADAGTPAAQRIHDIMERQVNHLVRLVDDLMEISRITRGSFELRREPLELQEVLRNAIETAMPLIDGAGHELCVRLPQEPLHVEADAVRLAQVFANLLNNAAKYTPDRGRIELEAGREGDQAVISVSDTGEGIDPEQLPRLFEMFTQGNRTSRRSQGGLGIGLSLARRLVERHGGTVQAESAGVGQGSRFTVRLPLGAAAPASQRAPRETAGLVPQRVLVVDDNRDAATSLGMLLNFLGADVHVAHDGPAAVEAFTSYRPGIVLLDIGMPGMDGYDVAREIRSRANGARLRLVALTGWGQEEDRRRVQEAGFDHHLVKPADIEALRGLLS